MDNHATQPLFTVSITALEVGTTLRVEAPTLREISEKGFWHKPQTWYTTLTNILSYVDSVRYTYRVQPAPDAYVVCGEDTLTGTPPEVIYAADELQVVEFISSEFKSTVAHLLHCGAHVPRDGYWFERCVVSGMADVCSAFLNLHGDTYYIDTCGCSCRGKSLDIQFMMFQAADRGDLEIVKVLWMYVIKKESMRGESLGTAWRPCYIERIHNAMICAVRKRRHDVVSYLREWVLVDMESVLANEYLRTDRKDVQVRRYRELMLRRAAIYGMLGIVDRLVKCGVDYHAIEPHTEKNAFLFACEFGHLDVVKYFVELGMDVGVCEVRAIHTPTPISVSLQYRHCDIVQYLVEHGAYVRVDYIMYYVASRPVVWLPCGKNMVQYLLEQDMVPSGRHYSVRDILCKALNYHEHVYALLDYGVCPYPSDIEQDKHGFIAQWNTIKQETTLYLETLFAERRLADLVPTVVSFLYY